MGTRHKDASHFMRMYGANPQNFFRQSTAVARLGMAVHEALAEFHTVGGDYVVPSIEEAEARVSAALGYDPRNHRGHRL